jgi:hypothetical protein
MWTGSVCLIKRNHASLTLSIHLFKQACYGEQRAGHISDPSFAASFLSQAAVYYSHIAT